MKLTLTNFGVWTSKTFVFSDNGLTLISGQSGKGKTTIFRAINYALTGSGTKLPTLGEKKCTVKFEYQGCIIQRSNSPSRLTLNIDDSFYEDDEAQSIIHRMIGKNFEVAGYIHQKGENSFLCMSPADKLRFLEKVAFSDVPIEELKEKAKEMVISSELQLTSVQGELKYLQENTVAKPEKFPLSLSEITSKLSSLQTEINTLNATREDLEKKRMTQTLLREKKTQLLSRIQEMSTSTPVPPELEENNEQSDLLRCETFEKFSEEKKNIQNLKEHQERQTKEIEEIQKKINELTTLQKTRNLPEIQSQIKEYSQYLQDYQKQEQNKLLKSGFSQSRFDFLQEHIPLCEEKLRTLLQSKEVRSCPKCHSHLRILKDTIVSFECPTSIQYSLEEEKRISSEISDFKKEFSKLQLLQSQIESLEELDEEIELDPNEISEGISKLKEIESVFIERQKKIQELERDFKRISEEQSRSVFQKKIQEFERLDEPTLPNRTKSEIQKRILDIRLRRQEIERIQSSNLEMKVKKELLEKEYLLLVVDETNFEFDQNSLQKAYQEQLRYSQLEKDYQIFKKDTLDYKKYTESLQKLRDEVKILENRYTLAKKFRENVNIAEMLSLNGLIEEINTHLAVYLNLFFPENPLTLELCLFKANDKTKVIRNQVNIQIGYRGAITDLTTLSGGEKDRVNLAFTLALAEIFNIQLLMLDETLSSLDRETTENILEHIQKDSRCILVVAHQVSTGLFDHVFEI